MFSLSTQNTFSSKRSADTVVADDTSNSTPGQRPSANPSSTSETTQGNYVPPGYPKMAERMGTVPELAVFRRFAFLNKLNLLHLQAELVDIEEKLKKAQRDDDKGSEYQHLYARDWFFLNRSSVDDDDVQLKLLLNAREKLEKYNTALIQQSFILPMKRPGKSDLRYLQSFIASQEMGPFALEGQDREIWGNLDEPKSFAADIITLLPRKNEDTFSSFLAEYGISQWFKWGFDKFRKPSKVTGLVGYEEGTLLRLTYLAATAIASILPVLSIVVLYYVHSMEARLGIIAAFNLLISFSLALFTSAKRTDIFAVTAAFSAVQVVFVQGDNGSMH